MDNATNETGYEVQRQGSGGAWGAVARLGPDVESYTDTPVPAHRTHCYRVRAGNPDGSTFSNQACTVTLPKSPATLQTLAVGETQINLNWTDSAGNEEEFKINEYADDGSWVLIATLDKYANSYSHEDLQPGTEHCYQVVASNESGDSLMPPEACATTAISLPVAPTGLVATPIGTARIDLAWTDNADNETSFTINEQADDGSWVPIDTVSANVTYYAHTGLTPGVELLLRGASVQCRRDLRTHQQGVCHSEPTGSRPRGPAGHRGRPASTRPMRRYARPNLRDSRR